MLSLFRQSAQRVLPQCQSLAQYATKPKNSKPEGTAASAKAEEKGTPAPANAVATAGQTLPQKKRTKWEAITLPEEVVKDIPVVSPPVRFGGDLRSTSGLGLGDGLKSHTAKWLEGNKLKVPMECIEQAEPIEVEGLVAISYGSDDPALGCPAEYIDLRGTSIDKPAVCKYTGNKFYSNAWKDGGAHH